MHSTIIERALINFVRENVAHLSYYLMIIAPSLCSNPYIKSPLQRCVFFSHTMLSAGRQTPFTHAGSSRYTKYVPL